MTHNIHFLLKIECFQVYFCNTKMGFDLYIGMKMNLNPDTGLPYDLVNALPVPEVFRRFINQRGHHWHHYIKHFNADYEYEASASEFLEYYPTWSEVTANADDWSESDHDMFKAALIWFKQKGCFYVSWSY